MPKSDKVNVKERVSDNVCDLSLSEINEVPVREIAAFKRVTVLDLSSNRLITLGKNFPCLTRLVKLDLSKNQIKYLPEDFGLLRNLRHLDLYDNKLEHLPLSFGSLGNLRYLDLKGNPLTPALAKFVGFCLTTKECQDSARNTVKFLAHMQMEAIRAKAQFQLEMLTQAEAQLENAASAEKLNENQKTKKSNSKKTKSKSKKSNSSPETAKETNATLPTQINKAAKAKKPSSGAAAAKKNGAASAGSTALTSILTFFLLLAINILIIYMIMFKNPEIAEKLVELIPHQYRDWLLSKMEIFRLHVTDWITEFRTPPEEH